MNRDEAIELLRGGQEGIKKWNRRREEGEEIPDLDGANLSRANLREANLDGANLSRVNLILADLTIANLCRANLREANLDGANLSRANLSGAELTNARCGWSIFGGTDLASAKGLKTIKHGGPSTIGLDTLSKSQGKISKKFLRGCGLLPWQVEFARLHDPDLSDGDIAELLTTKVFEARTKGPLYIGGVFISYSREDAKFVDKIYKHLYDAGASVWLDRHHAVAGDVQKQVSRAIRVNDVVLLVLSEWSVESAWVEHELEMASIKEKEEKRDVLCPVALDGSWKEKVRGDVLWRQIKRKNVLDFSGWKTKKFGPQFEKLTKGLKINF